MILVLNTFYLKFFFFRRIIRVFIFFTCVRVHVCLFIMWPQIQNVQKFLLFLFLVFFFMWNLLFDIFTSNIDIFLFICPEDFWQMFQELSTFLFCRKLTWFRNLSWYVCISDMHLIQWNSIWEYVFIHKLDSVCLKLHTWKLNHLSKIL